MNDLDQLREFRAEIPYPERPRLSAGRSRLHRARARIRAALGGHDPTSVREESLP